MIGRVVHADCVGSSEVKTMRVQPCVWVVGIGSDSIYWWDFFIVCLLSMNGQTWPLTKRITILILKRSSMWMLCGTHSVSEIVIVKEKDGHRAWYVIGRNFRFGIVIIIFDVKCIWPWKCMVPHWCSAVTDVITILNETTMHAGGHWIECIVAYASHRGSMRWILS